MDGEEGSETSGVREHILYYFGNVNLTYTESLQPINVGGFCKFRNIRICSSKKIK